MLKVSCVRWVLNLRNKFLDTSCYYSSCDSSTGALSIIVLDCEVKKVYSPPLLATLRL